MDLSHQITEEGKEFFFSRGQIIVILLDVERTDISYTNP